MPRWFVTSLAVLGVALVAVLVVVLSNGRGSSSASAVGASVTGTGTVSVAATASPTGTATVTATATASPTVTSTPEPEPEEPPEAGELLLRLTDVPPGYTIGDDSGCGQLTPEGADARLGPFIAGEFPEFCIRQMEYVCRERAEDIPLVITSGVIFLSTESKAGDGMELVPSIARWLLGTPAIALRSDDAAADADEIEVGDEVLVYEVEGINDTTGVLIAWRNGTTLNLIEVIEPPEELALFMVEALAQVQNHRYTDPLAPEDSDTYDAEVSLNCGDSEVPVYWLGALFKEDGLPKAELARGTGPISLGQGPGMEYMLEYESDLGLGFDVSIWTAEQWETFLASEAGQFATSRPCAVPAVFELDDRMIEIHAPSEGCNERYMAHVLFPEAIVTINVPLGAFAGTPETIAGSFDTPEALEQLARALRRR